MLTSPKNLSQISSRKDRQESAIYAFTVVTIIFLPLSTLAGIFGMNTNDIRNLQLNQWVYWAVAVPLTCLVVYACFAWIDESGPAGIWRRATNKEVLPSQPTQLAGLQSHGNEQLLEPLPGSQLRRRGDRSQDVLYREWVRSDDKPYYRSRRRSSPAELPQARDAMIKEYYAGPNPILRRPRIPGYNLPATSAMREVHSEYRNASFLEKEREEREREIEREERREREREEREWRRYA